MSGICGIVGFRGQTTPREAIEPMLAAARHRSGKEIHVWTGPGVVLADLTHDPEDRRLILTADARIDNHAELIGPFRGEGLLTAGTPTDRELILAAYLHWGESCAGHLIGDFAFAIWDSDRRRLFAARDPMGMRALYYRPDSQRFAFATEAQQILRLPGVAHRMFEPAVAAHLAGPYGLPNWSFYEGIEQLAPGHSLAVDETGLRTWRHWDIDAGASIRYRRESEYVDHFGELFRRAVADRLRPAEKPGLLLSGGLDSGSTAAVAGRLAEDGQASTLRVYSWAFEELEACDERAASRPIIHTFGLPSRDIPADDAWPLAEYPRHGPHADDPLLSVYEVLHERALDLAGADGVRVLLSAERGDEVVGDWVYDFPGLFRTGHWWALAGEIEAMRRERRQSLPSTLRRTLLDPWLAGRRGGAGAKRGLRESGAGSGHEAPRMAPWVRPEFARRTQLPDIMTASTPTAPTAEPARQLRYERIFMHAGMRRAMALERRRAGRGIAYADPWSDRRLAEFVMAVPQHVLNRVREPKRIVKRAMRGVMPDAALSATRKLEPVALFHRGFRERAAHTVRELMTDSLSARYGFLDAGELETVYSAYVSGEPVRYDFWWPLSLEIWLRAHWDEKRR